MKRKSIQILLLLCFFLFSNGLFANQDMQNHAIDSIALHIPNIIVKNTETKITLLLFCNNEQIPFNDTLTTKINQKNLDLIFINGESQISKVYSEKETITASYNKISSSKNINPIPLWYSIIPPLIAIIFALLFKEVFSALLLGIFSGTLIISLHQGFGIFKAILQAFMRLIDTYVIQALNDSGHLSIIVFSMLIGGMVGIITKNGGMQGIVEILSRKANNSRSGQLATWFLGIAIFFDDYANTLVVGNTMRNVTDKLKISREKLAYIVDSTAAPIAAIAFITTWIGAELSYIQDGVAKIGLDINPYNVFFASLKYSFYPILTIGFVFILIMSRRDYGPMYHKELKARNTNSKTLTNSKLNETKTLKSSHWNAILPVAIIIFGTIAGLLYTGWDTDVWNSTKIGFGNKLSQTIGNGDSFKALLWASLGGVFLAITITVAKKLMNLRETIDAMIEGFKSMLSAILILTFAWALALLTENLHTAEFISFTMDSLSVSPPWIPAISFVFSAAIAFSTGSSWGTMAIMYPLILPSSWLICMNNGLDTQSSLLIFNNVVSTVIAGSVLGDHCSPISDTTILSSLASGCPHMQHVRTQMPYALTVGAVSLLLGVIPSAFGIPFYLLIPLDFAVLYLIIRLFGKKLPITKLKKSEFS